MNCFDVTAVDVWRKPSDHLPGHFAKLAPENLHVCRIDPVDLEEETNVRSHALDFDLLRTGFEAQTNELYMVMQGHPPYWDAASKAIFPKIVDYLISKNARFMTPYQYYQSLPH